MRKIRYSKNFYQSAEGKFEFSGTLLEWSTEDHKVVAIVETETGEVEILQPFMIQFTKETKLEPYQNWSSTADYQKSSVTPLSPNEPYQPLS